MKYVVQERHEVAVPDETGDLIFYREGAVIDLPPADADHWVESGALAPKGKS